MPFPDLPSLHAIAVLVLTVVALYLFRREDLPLETSSLAVVCILAIGFEVFPYVQNGVTLHSKDFLLGFGHEALIAVCGLMIAGQGLVRTGALEPVGRMLGKLWRKMPLMSLLITLVVAAALSAFMNNTPIVVLLLPILTAVAVKAKQSSSSMLMPMGLATLVGGTCTTIGTSTNLLVVSIAADLGLRQIQIFDFAIPAMIVGGIGIIYLWIIAPLLLPDRQLILSEAKPRLFSAHLNIVEDSFAEGKTLSDIIKKTDNMLKVKRIKRANVMVMPLPDTVLRAGDRLDVQDTPERLKEYEQVTGAALFSKGMQVSEENPLSEENQQIAELIIVNGSPLVGRTLGEVKFSDYYSVVTLALHRQGKSIETTRKGIGAIPLQIGDILLVQGSAEQLQATKKSGDFLVLDQTSDLPHTEKAFVALGIMLMIITVAALGIVPISVSALCGVMAMLLTKCLDWRDVSNALSAPVVLIVVASLALGSAMMKTGGAEYLAEIFVYFSQGAAPAYVLSGLVLLLAILTNVVSNNAAAVIGTPIAISVAQHLNLPPEPFVIAVLFGANLSYATPMAYKTNLLVMNAGGYTFSDFMRIGIPLTILMWLGFSFVLPWYYGI
jgi:di/tricarboxylate transporter